MYCIDAVKETNIQWLPCQEKQNYNHTTRCLISYSVPRNGHLLGDADYVYSNFVGVGGRRFVVIGKSCGMAGLIAHMDGIWKRDLKICYLCTTLTSACWKIMPLLIFDACTNEM